MSTPVAPVAPAPAPPAAPVSPEFDIVKQAILASMNGELSPLNLAVVVTAAMNVLKGKKKLTGPQKKALVIEVLDTVMAEQGLEEQERAQLMYIVPSLIDQLYAVGKGGNCCTLL